MGEEKPQMNTDDTDKENEPDLIPELQSNGSQTYPKCIYPHPVAPLITPEKFAELLDKIGALCKPRPNNEKERDGQNQN